MSDHISSKERTAFERWLLANHGLESEWQESRNCYKEFAAHLAWCAWQAAQSSVETPDEVVRLRALVRAMVIECEENMSAKAVWLAQRNGDGLPEETTGAPQLWYCPNCRSGNRVDFHHTSCPACGKLRPAEKAPARQMNQAERDAMNRAADRSATVVDEGFEENGPAPHSQQEKT